MQRGGQHSGLVALGSFRKLHISFLSCGAGQDWIPIVRQVIIQMSDVGSGRQSALRQECGSVQSLTLGESQQSRMGQSRAATRSGASHSARVRAHRHTFCHERDAPLFTCISENLIENVYPRQNTAGEARGTSLRLKQERLIQMPLLGRAPARRASLAGMRLPGASRFRGPPGDPLPVVRRVRAVGSRRRGEAAPAHRDAADGGLRRVTVQT